ncbi:39S ribosomal protein L46, mitochondrial-like isoform X1 [Sinocyclocheilus anshuiensis]|uniref:39S ribosomal protein L46, mitochondrial-like isoform X1 n=1 Tax=Sinocyclocheilus anshuiensis TaxID=1608454 RepID=UPI0007BAB61D|nr:PREDICTED: 39S ribosomal protein L46, mitochondrial-like isoform X1 [Sinocyclocheilus anshuiensis]
MAAPFSRLCRPLWRITTTSTLNKGVRNVSSSRQQWSAQNVKTAGAASPWALHGALCLQRLPVVSQDGSPIEEDFMELMHLMELERSLLSDHELRLLEDAARMSRKQEEDYDSDEEDYRDNEIVTAQDLEDIWEQKPKQFQPAPRSQGVDEKDVSSSERCLADSLILLAKKDVGSQKLWLLPQIQWQTGETLRQTAERALASLPVGADKKATFLGSAPCGFYKYKYPKEIQKEGSVGAKVFFFKAVLSSHKHLPLEKNSFAWVKKEELQDFLKPEYLKQVRRFIMAL